MEAPSSLDSVEGEALAALIRAAGLLKPITEEQGSTVAAALDQPVARAACREALARGMTVRGLAALLAHLGVFVSPSAVFRAARAPADELEDYAALEQAYYRLKEIAHPGPLLAHVFEGDTDCAMPVVEFQNQLRRFGQTASDAILRGAMTLGRYQALERLLRVSNGPVETVEAILRAAITVGRR